MQVLVGMLWMLQRSEPFLTYPQLAARDCPMRHCLAMPEDSPPPQSQLTYALLDSSSFFVPPPRTARPSLRPASGDSSRLQLTGSKSISSSVSGSGVLIQQEMTLDVAGEPTPGLAVKAHLSDKDAPLGSSGSTSSLRQTDEVWIDARSRRFHGRVGDLSVSPPPGLLGTDNRNARGLVVELGDSALHTWGSLAGSRSQWIRREITGITGIQEGYSVSDGNASRALVPGTERVWLDGILLRRGSDYELKAADGVLDFLPSRRILSSSRITVEVQAADRDYEGSIASGGAGLATSGVRWEAWAFRAADDPRTPLSYVSDSTSLRRLEEAGSDTTLLRTAGSEHIPLPTSQIRTGTFLSWNTLLPGSIEARLSRTDANLASERDPVRTGGAMAGQATTRQGTAVTRGGSGLWSLASSFQAWQAAYAPLRPPAPDTSQGGWMPASSFSGSHDQERLDLGWEAIPSLGLRTSGRHFHLEDWGDLTSAGLTLGLDRDSSHQILLTRTLAQLDQGRKFRQDEARFQGIWDREGLAPSLQASRGARGEARSATTSTQRSWLGGSAGLRWQRQFGSLAFHVHAREEGNDFGTGTVVDSSRSLQSILEGQLQTEHWNATLLLDRLDEKVRREPHSSLQPSTHWLAESKAAWTPIPTGMKFEGHYRLSTSQWRPTLAVYDTVTPGTGKYRYDSASNEVVLDEFGDLILAGTRLDSLHPARQSGNVLLTLGTTLVPKEINPGLAGLLADLSTQIALELEQVDSSQNRLLPDFHDRDLARSILGRSRLDGQLWWTHRRWQGRLHLERTYKNSIENWSYMSDQEEIDTKEISIKKEIFDQIEGKVATGTSSRAHKWSYYSDLFSKNWIEPSLLIQWQRFESELDIRYQAGTQSHADQETKVTLFSQAISLGWHPSQAATLSGSVRHFDITSLEEPASWLTDNYPSGSSWRIQTGLDWNSKGAITAAANWILRITPTRPADQKLELQAKALF